MFCIDCFASAAVQGGVNWPVRASDVIENSPWFQVLPRREQEDACVHICSNLLGLSYVHVVYVT
jgi:hypothetical protein